MNMKKIYFGIIAMIGLMSFSSCDKIEADANGRYVTYAGSVAQWQETTPLDKPVQRALVEKYTGPRCPNCPNADVTLTTAQENLGEQMVLIAITPSAADGEPYEGQLDMRTEDGDQWAETLIGNLASMSLPVALLNRHNKYQGAPTISGVEADANTAVAQSPLVALDVTATTKSGNDVSIEVTVDYRQELHSELMLTLVLTEDSLQYWQSWAGHNPALVKDYAHNHMLRDVITDVWGVDVEATGDANKAVKGSFNYTLPANVVKENCHIVAFISKKSDKEVINCAECTIE